MRAVFSNLSIRAFFRGAMPAVAMAAVLALAGCKASEAPDSGFLQETHQMKNHKIIPFHRSYWNREYRPISYSKIVIAPVNTDYVMAQKIWEKATVINVDPEQVKKDIGALADYTRNSFIRAFKEDPNKRFEVVDAADKQTLILEMAIVQVVPSKAVMNALGYVSWVPMATSTAASTVSDSEDWGKGVIAIEGRIRDGASGKVIGMFADRERPPAAFLDLKALTWWSPAQSIVDAWAAQMVQIANLPPGTSIKDAPTFELMVW